MAAKGKPAPRPIQKPAAKAAAATASKTSEILPFWTHHWVGAALLMFTSFALYFQSLRYGYVLDDQMVIWDNAYVQKGFAGLRDIFAYDSFMGFFKEKKFLLEGGRYRPLSLATFAVEVALFGPSKPFIGHFFNVVLYGLTGILLFRVLLQLFPIREGGRWYFSLPFLGAFVFMVHPLHVEVVANIKGRDEIMALMGSFGALYAMLKYFDTEKKLWWWLSGLSLFLGLMSKENSLTFLAVIPLTLWFFTKIPLGRILSSMVPLLAACALFLLCRYNAMGYMLNHGISVTDVMNNPFVGMARGEKFATIFLTLGWYVKLLFVPNPLTHDYYPYHVPKVGWDDWRALVSLALYVGLGAWALWQMTRARREPRAPEEHVPAWSVLYFLATLSIVSNLFVGVGTFMNERFAFMPSVAFCAWAGWLLARKIPALLNEKHDNASILGAGTLVLGTALSLWIIWTRVPEWQSALTLNTSAVRKSPGSCRSHCFYATALYQDYSKVKDPATKASMAWVVDSMEVHIDKSIAINPTYPAALQMKAAIAASRFEQDKQLDKLFHAWGIVLEKIPNNQQVRKFVGDYMKYLKGRANPNKYTAFCHRIGYEFFYKEKNDLKSALEFLTYAEEIQVEDTRILEDLAEVYQANGYPAKAVEMRERAEASKR